MNNNNFPTIITSDYQRELQSYELENARPAVEGFPTLAEPDPNLSPDFKEFSNTSETQIQQELYKTQERPVSSLYTRLREIKEKLKERKSILHSQLRQVEEQIETVNKQLGKLS